MPRRRAKRGEGGVTYDRTAGNWVARYPLGVVKGKRRYLKAHARTEDDAWDEWDRLAREAGAGSDVTSRTTVDAYLTAWLASHGRTVRESTLASYTNHVTLHISPLLGGIRLHRLRPEDVDRLVADRLAAGKSPATVVRIVTTLRIALGRAVRRRILPENVAALAAVPRVEQRLVEPMTEAQAANIVDALDGSWMRPVVVLILGSALRVGEACGLDWGDVFEDDGYVVVRRTKTRPRAVPISDDAAEMLRGLRRERTLVSPSAPVFVRERRGRGDRADDLRIRQQSVSHGLPDLLEAKGLPRVSPHGLRHGAATIMVSRGVHMRVIAEQLGHRDGGALAGRVYAHVVPSHMRDAARTLNRRKA